MIQQTSVLLIQLQWCVITLGHFCEVGVGPLHRGVRSQGQGYQGPLTDAQGTWGGRRCAARGYYR